MKPDRSNYEIWIIDWLDGNLTVEQTAGLNSFLADNPDLREEAEMAAQSRLRPQNVHMKNKKGLLREPAGLPLPQFEQLSVAFLEGDITKSEAEELNIILAADPQKRKLFDIVQKTRLHPQTGQVFRHKNELLRKEKSFTIGSRQKVWLSSAAAIALLVVSYFIIPRDNSPLITEGNTVAPASEIPDPVILQKIAFRDPPVLSTIAKGNENSASKTPVPYNEAALAQAPGLNTETSLTNTTPDLLTEVSRIPLIKPYQPGYIREDYTLTALNTDVPDFETDDDGTRLGRFVSRNFRERILKVDKPLDDPLKPYEIAEAGIEGLNKLFGWEMALVQNTDDEGELQSVYFSSKILKFNSPVKKANPAP